MQPKEERFLVRNRTSFLVDVDSLKPHPEWRRYAVPMPKEAWDRLYESIRRYGIRVPLSIWNAQILDGVHRWKAAKQLGVKHVPVLPLELEDEEEARIWMIRANLDRRHLTSGQRAMLVKLLYEIEKEKASQRRARQGRDRGGKFSPTVEPQEKGKARDRAAARAGISGRTLEKALKAVEKRPDLEEKLRKGEISVDRAYRLATGRTPTPKPRQEQPRPQEQEPEPVIELQLRPEAKLWEWLCELAKHFATRPGELALRAVREWAAMQTPWKEEPKVCVSLPLRHYRVWEELAGPDPIADLVRYALCSLAMHYQRYPELVHPALVRNPSLAEDGEDE